MAHGSSEKFALDLDDIIAFPDARHMPVLPPEPGESWIILLEVLHFCLSKCLKRADKLRLPQTNLSGVQSS
jgi:hypothetical protein